jgi:FtsZ-interacting cell division protein ZipA
MVNLVLVLLGLIAIIGLIGALYVNRRDAQHKKLKRPS